MADIGAVVLHKVLKEKNLEGWSKLKLAFFNAAYSSVYAAINKYYHKYNAIPDFNDLDLYIRDATVKQNTYALSTLEVPEIDLDFAIDALISEYTQNEALKLIDGLVSEITLMESEEVKDAISDIAMKLDEKTHTSTTVVNADNLVLFEPEENLQHTKVYLGISNTFEAEEGCFRADYIVVGGYRGAGKSVVCANVIANQYEIGDVGVYLTIEMRAKATWQRILSILSNVPAKHVLHNRLTEEELLRLAKVRSEMFISGIDHYNDFLKHKDKFLLEAKLTKECKLKESNQIIVIDDSSLTLPSIDVHLQKIKAKFGAKLKVVAVDYLNQITVPGKNVDKYDWKTQIEISSKLKELAHKYDIAVFSAFQIDEENRVRFAKGILDSPDLCYILDPNKPEDSAMSFDNTKTRSGKKLSFTQPINWDTLRINPIEIPKPEKKQRIKKEAADPPPEKDSLPF